MKGSWRLGELAGIDIYVHWSFLILPAVIGLSSFGSGGLAAAVGSVLFVLAIFGCVVLHELGHALAARRYGIGTRNITLLPIGGVANLERMPRQPRQELAIALAGPAVNAVIAAGIYLGLYVLGGAGQLLSAGLLSGTFLERLMWANVALGIFNLLPAFPMDGGRVLRALLALRLPHARATDIAAGVGQAMALAFLVLGLFGNWTLIFIAMFVFLAGRAEAQMARAQAAAQGIYLDEVRQQPVSTVRSDARIEEVARQLLFSSQRDFPVIQNGRLVGVIAASDVLAAMANGAGHLCVARLLRQNPSRGGDRVEPEYA
jgi:Zn-dependent protease